jgi:hypothetical protein
LEPGAQGQWPFSMTVGGPGTSQYVSAIFYLYENLHFIH